MHSAWHCVVVLRADLVMFFFLYQILLIKKGNKDWPGLLPGEQSGHFRSSFSGRFPFYVEKKWQIFYTKICRMGVQNIIYSRI